MDGDKELKEILTFDPLDFVEKVYGSYRDNPELSLFMAMEHNKEKEAALIRAGDTSYSSSLSSYIDVLAHEGFRMVLGVPFKGDNGDELLAAWWHRDGILLIYDTYTFVSDNPKVNGCTFYYNWEPNDPSYGWKIGQSGHYLNNTWVGYQDGREALRFHLRELRTKGKFVKPWIECPTLYSLISYKEWHQTHNMNWEEKSNFLDRIISERINALPSEVRDYLGPSER